MEYTFEDHLNMEQHGHDMYIRWISIQKFRGISFIVIEKYQSLNYIVYVCILFLHNIHRNMFTTESCGEKTRS